ncbi:MAG TPA: class A beta-lactamase-related serine hydrolase [Candidatus Levilactobacillus faecigallinarum]|uniref:Class A beta-lactamase-related serine hydrolase n=1 Tax=Candidatus Levilactobacillus faecigallinarum TaxID=2838638 RepID=A0A9D1U5K3_9LACO|nr:class A beta-lactamase-related serine hydrolase [Candidatus Levilactobacillus faecigallinarum]
MLVIAAAVTVGGLIPTVPASAKSYLTITSSKNTSYNARFVNQSKRNDGIYYYAPYYTQRSAKTRDASGKNWQHRFVRISQTATLSNGTTYVKFSWYGKTIGWVNQSALQKFSRTSNAQALLTNAHFKGRAMLFNHYATGASHVSVGYADAASQSNNDSNTLFPIASLQKVMTGAIIEQLASSNKLSMNDKLSKYYPSVNNSQNITIRQLLNHRSGVSMDETTPSTVLTTQAAELNYTLQQLKTSTNQNFNYTNANYTLLAAVASKVTGQSYDTLVTNRIIKPLKLTNTYAWDNLPTDQLAATGYAFANGQDYSNDTVSQKLMSSLLGAGNYYSTPEDYYTFQKGLRNGKVLTKSQYTDLANNGAYTYAGGLYHYSGGIKRVRGALSGAGYNTVYYGTEGNKYGVILFANQSPTKSIDTLAQTLYDLASYYNEN